MKIPGLLRTSTFQLSLLYMVVFATSVFILLAFIYWRTAGYMAAQTDETIEAEIVGLAEQYRGRGINGLLSIIRERVERDPDGKSIYLFTTSDYRKLAGNLNSWPQAVQEQEGWINFPLTAELTQRGDLHEARARVFEVQGELRLLVGRDVHDLLNLKQLIEQAINLGMGVTLALALVGGIMMSRGTAHRIEIINQTSRRIMGGQLSLRIPTRGTRDDFDQLADNLNQMLDRIVYLMEGIRHVSDNIAHDLRTPLTRLRNQLENTLLSVDDAHGRDQVALAVAEADQLLGTFNALLRIARLETGGKLTDRVPVQLGQLVTDAVELYEALAEEKGQQLHLALGSAGWVDGDRDLLFQAISNLIDNAIKYTPDGGDVFLALVQVGALVQLSVSDTGVGVPDEEKGRVFQRFYRVAHSRSLPGNGLGLSLVHAVVELHHGGIRLSDTRPGHVLPGLSVRIDFPVSTTSNQMRRRSRRGLGGEGQQ